jgi:uncharacterized protein HemX
MDWFKSRTHIAALVLFGLGVYLAWTGNAAGAVMPIALGLGLVGIRGNQQRNAEMIARQMVIAKKLAAKIPLTEEEKEQLAADGIGAAQALAGNSPAEAPAK